VLVLPVPGRRAAILLTAVRRTGICATQDCSGRRNGSAGTVPGQVFAGQVEHDDGMLSHCALVVVTALGRDHVPEP
jgi:hypothetical protein